MLTTTLRRALVASAFLLAATNPAPAQSLQWGPGGLGGAGTWDNGVTANWFNGTTNVPWSATNVAVFGGTAGAVTVNGTIPGVAGLTFNLTGYTLSGGTLTLTGNAVTVATGVTATVGSTLTATAGVALGGGGALVVTGGMTGTNNHVELGTLTLDTPAAFTNNFTAFSSIGRVAGNNGTLNIVGATNYTNAGDFNVGDVGDSRGTVNVNTTGVVQFNTLYVGKNATTVGVLNLVSGTVQSNPAAGGDWRLTQENGAQNAYGVINQSGGQFNTIRNFQIGAGGVGVYNMTGGTATLSGFIAIGRFNDADSAGNGLLNINAGTFTVNGNDNFIIGEQGRGVVNQFGGSLVTGGTRFGTNNAGAVSSVYNLLGGTTTVERFFKDGAITNAQFYINGGTITPRNANDAGAFLQGLDRTTVGPAGGTFNTNGIDVTVNQVLVAPSGDGVATIAVTDGGSGYVGEPVVVIDGLQGATARAVVTGGVVTAIQITNPGNDYAAAPVVSLRGGGATTPATLGAVTLAPNAASGSLVKAGAGTLTLTGANTFTGPLTITAGTVAVPTINDNGVAGPLGAQATAAGLVFNGGTLRYTGATASTARTFSTSGTNVATFDVTTAGANLTFTGAAPATATGIAKVGPGILTLSFSALAGYTGTTSVAGGILAPVGTYATPFAVNAGGRLNSTYQAVAPLTVGSLTLGAGSGLDFDFTTGGGGNDVITVSTANGLTLGTTSLNLFQAGGAAAFADNGTYPLLQYTTGFTGTLLGAFSVTNSVPGKVYSVNNNAGASRIELVINDALAATWNVDGGGSWATAASWTGGVPNGVGAVATFGAVYTGTNPPATITLDGNKTVGSLIFANANSYLIAPGTGGTLTVDNGIATALVSATLGSHTVAVPLALPNPTNLSADAGATLTLSGGVSGAGRVTKIGAGTVVLSGAGTYTGATMVAAGTLDLAAANAVGGTPSLTVQNTAILRASAAGVTVPAIAFDLNGAAAVNIPGTANGTGNFAIDVTTGSSLTVAGNVSSGGGSLVKTGAGTLTLTGPGANTLAAGAGTIAASVQAGTLTLNGGGAATYAVTGELVVGDNTPTAGTLNVQSGTLNVSTFLSLGRGNGTTGLASAINVTGGTVNAANFFTGFANGVAGYQANPVVNLSGAATVNATAASRLAESAGSTTTVTMTGTATYFVQNNLEVGFSGVAVVKVGAGTTLNANQFLFGNSGGGGAVWNRGTLVVRSGASTNHFALGNSVNGYGYYLHDTATPTTLQEIGVGGAGGGSGVLELRSGTIGIGQWVTLNRTNGANATSATLLINGGTLTHNVANQFYVNQNVAASQYGTIEVLGTGRLAGGAVNSINLNNNSLSAATTNLTVSGGGVVSTTRVFAAQAIGNTFVNLNGGTLRATAAGALLDNNLDAVTVYAGGATVDTNGFNTTFGTNALLAPAGNGITAIPLAAGGTGYVGRPVVNIADPTGTGATAIANFDEATGVLTGITLTSPGSNYTAPTITLVGGGATTAATVNAANVTLAPAPTTGGLTKVGAGTLTLGGSSTYGGPTLVNAGTLSVTNTAGSATGTGPVTAATGAVVRGTGTIAGPLTVNSGATVRGGTGVGTLTLGGGLTVNAGGGLYVEIADGSTFGAPSTGASTVGTLPNPTSNNFLNVTGGTTTISPAAVITLDGTAATFAAGNYSYVIASGAGNQSALSITAPGQFTLVGTTGFFTNLSVTGSALGSVYVNFTYSPVPEPATILGVAALAGLGVQGWKRRGRWLKGVQ